MKFELNKNEIESFEKFKKKKEKKFGKKTGLTDYIFMFSPTPLGGDGIRVKCRLGGKSKDISDYDSW